LDYGTNIYLIEAYSWDEVGRAEVTIIIPRPWEENVSSNSSVSNNVVTNPENINSLTIKQIEPDLEITTSDAVNAFLYENLWANAWFYWNSLRPIKNNVWASFYAIVLNWDTYSYSRYYYAPNGTYGVLLLETWTDINKENIWDKNVEFRERNASFDTSEADTYFINLLNS
jgi:hypothetical protein